MISKQAVEEQLKRIGCNFRFWGRSEINELGRILMEDEVIAQCVNGEYSNGFAMLVATNHRLLLVDKKPLLYLTVEDVRYDMITEFNYNHRMMNAAINIYTANKTLAFTSWNQHRLRKLMEYAQARVLEMHQHQHLAQQFTAAAAAQYAQLHAAQAIQAMPNYQAPAPLQQPQSRQHIGAPQAPVALPAATSSAGVPEQSKPRPPASPSPTQVASGFVSKLSSGRAALGTYTRNKLPNLRRQRLWDDQERSAGGNGLPMPYEYEG